MYWEIDFARQGTNGRSPKCRCSVTVSHWRQLYVSWREQRIDCSARMEKNCLTSWKGLAKLQILQRKLVTVHLNCFIFSDSVSAAYQPMLLLNFIWLLTDIILNHEMLDNVKVTEITEVAILSDLKMRISNCFEASVSQAFAACFA